MFHPRNDQILLSYKPFDPGMLKSIEFLGERNERWGDSNVNCCQYSLWKEFAVGVIGGRSTVLSMHHGMDIEKAFLQDKH